MLIIELRTAENMHYPVSDVNELVEFLKQVDVKVLSKKTFQDDYNPGLGRKMLNRIWTVVVESNVENTSPMILNYEIELIFFR